MRRFALGLAVGGLVMLAVTTWSGRSASQMPAYEPAAQQPPAAIIAPTATPSAIPTAPCDETEELMARMFVGLTQAVLTESGTSPQAFASAIAADRETWKRYLEVLDIPVDEAWLDAVMAPGLDQRLLAGCLDP